MISTQGCDRSTVMSEFCETIAVVCKDILFFFYKLNWLGTQLQLLPINKAGILSGRNGLHLECVDAAIFLPRVEINDYK